MRFCLFLGLCGLLFVLAFSSLRDAWSVNSAGVALNRTLAAEQPFGQSSPEAEHESTAEGQLHEVLVRMQSTAARGSDSAVRQTSIWRTYGAAARLIPSEQAYRVLAHARATGSLDRIGQLWLGEVAAATGHTEEAAAAYRRVDAGNMLLSRAERYLEQGEQRLAAQQFLLAYGSVTATDGLLRSDTTQAASLCRIGRGLLSAGEPAMAVPVFEEALATAETSSPGAVLEQSIRLHLALALAKTLPPVSGAPADVSSLPTLYAVDRTDGARLRTIARIAGLVQQGATLDETAAACVQAGRVMLLVGHSETAVAYLRRAIDLDPLLAESYLVLGAFYEESLAVSTARELYKAGLELQPTHAGLAAAYAMAAYKSLPADLALPALQQAAGLPDVADPFVFARLGDCYRDLEMPGEARAAYEQGLEFYPQHAALVRRVAVLQGRGLMP